MIEITRWVEDGCLVRILKIDSDGGACFFKHNGPEKHLSWGLAMSRAEVAEELFARRPKRSIS